MRENVRQGVLQSKRVGIVQQLYIVRRKLSSRRDGTYARGWGIAGVLWVSVLFHDRVASPGLVQAKTGCKTG